MFIFISLLDSSWNIVETSYQKYLNKSLEKQEKEKKKQQQQEEERRKKEELKAEKTQPKVKELTKEEFERAKLEEELRNKINSNPELKEKIDIINSEENKTKTVEKEEDKVAEGKIRPNKGNGASNDKYFWYQYTIQEITIIIPVEKKITGKDIKIKQDSKHLSVTVAGETILNGELKHPMNVKITFKKIIFF